MNFAVTGSGPVVNLSFMSIAFGKPERGGPGYGSAHHSQHGNNTGGTTLNITSIAITGTNAGDFAEADTCWQCNSWWQLQQSSVTFTLQA